MAANTNDSEEVVMELWKKFLVKAIAEDVDNESKVLTIFVIVVFGVGLVANVVTCIVVYCDKTMHTATNYYLVHLAVSDVGFASHLLMQVNILSIPHEWKVMCFLHVFIIVFMYNNITLTVTALAIERYIAITNPTILSSKPIWKRMMKIILLIWIVSVMMTLPSLSTINLVKTENMSLCTALPTKATKIIILVMTILTFIIPMMTMAYVYMKIVLEVRKIEKINENNNVFNHHNNKSQVNKLAVAITLSFLICWGPFFCTRILLFSLSVKQMIRINDWWRWMGNVTFTLSSFSILINPVLFSLMSSKFRKALKKFWLTKIRGRPNEQDERTTGLIRRRKLYIKRYRDSSF